MVKVRFAPSPTGDLHIGNARTALINYAFSLKHGGNLILRIEDTDRDRSSKTSESSIIEDLKWLGIKYDEGPIRQSERFPLYRELANNLLQKGYVYKCFCSKEMLEKEREEALRKRMVPRYGERCKYLSPLIVKKFQREKRPYVLRFKSLKRPIVFNDAIKGRISFPKDHVDDFIILKEDLTPTYNFAAAVDDMLMGITHVIRGEDHLSNTPKQIMILEVFNGKIPSYAHHPLLLGIDGKPLSKRHGITKIKELREMGILKEALINYLFIIGRNLKEEILSIEEIIDDFSLSSLSSSNAHFDLNKLLWFNKEYIKRLSPKMLFPEESIDSEEEKRIEILKEDARTLNEIRSNLKIFHGSEIEEEALSYLCFRSETKEVVQLLEELINGEEMDFHLIFEKIQKKIGMERKPLLLILRAILTGRLSGPPLNDIFGMIEKRAINARIAWLKKNFYSTSP